MASFVDGLLENKQFLRAWGESEAIHSLVVMHLRGFEDTLIHGESIAPAQVKSLYSEFSQMVISELGAGSLTLFVSRLDTQLKALLGTLEEDLHASGSSISLVDMRMELNYFKLTSQPIAVMTRAVDHDGLQRFLERANDKDKLGIVHEVMRQARAEDSHTLFIEMLRSDLLLKEMANAHHCDSRDYSEASERHWFNALLTLNDECFNNDMQGVLGFALTESLERVYGEVEGEHAVRNFVLSVLQNLPENEQGPAARRFHQALASRADAWAALGYYDWLDIQSLFGMPVPEIAAGLAAGAIALNEDQKMALSFLEYESPFGGRSQTYPNGHDLHQMLKVSQAIAAGEKLSAEPIFRCMDFALREGAEEYSLGGLLASADLAVYATGPSPYVLKDIEQGYRFSVRSFFGLTLSSVNLNQHFNTILSKLESKPQASNTLFTLGKMLGMKDCHREVLRELNVDKGLPIEDLMKVMRLEREDVIADIRLKANLFTSELNV